MDEKEFNNIYAIPANYTDSGKLLGGMLETRNTIEAVLLLGLVGYPEIAWIHVDVTIKVCIMTVTLIPLGVVSLMGIGGGGDSLMQYLSHIVRFGLNRRKLHYRRIGYKYRACRPPPCILCSSFGLFSTRRFHSRKAPRAKAGRIDRFGRIRCAARRRSPLWYSQKLFGQVQLQPP